MTDERRRWATERIQAKRELWVHLFTYIAVNTLLVVIWAMTSASYFWPIWPIVGWGVGLAAHAIHVLVSKRAISEEQIDRELKARYGS